MSSYFYERIMNIIYLVHLCRYQSTATKGPKVNSQISSNEEPRVKRNLLDNASNLLTNILSGGKLGSMPTAEGAVSDLFGRPLFFKLYDWFLEVPSPLHII